MLKSQHFRGMPERLSNVLRKGVDWLILEAGEYGTDIGAFGLDCRAATIDVKSDTEIGTCER